MRSSESPFILRGPILNPQPSGAVDYRRDGIIVADSVSGTILFVGNADELPAAFANVDLPVQHSRAGVILPPFFDLHTHLPQFPIRGRFTEGIQGYPAEGRLLAGLRRNVFPEEARHADSDYAASVIDSFLQATLAHGVVGGAAYGTVHAPAARMALSRLPALWSVGLVLMNTNCPDYLRTDEATIERDIRSLGEAFGRRSIVTDRFAVSVTTPLRCRASAIAGEMGLRTQTHLNEQRSEKALIEQTLYPGYGSYTDVYRRDGLLQRGAILAHCIQMTETEWELVADSGAVIAHCPTSNTLLGSGTMPLDDLPAGVDYAICTDVGASPTCSLLAEMAQFLKVHRGRSRRATPSEALFRATFAPARILGLDTQIGTFAPGMPLSYIEVALTRPVPMTADEAILRMLGSIPAEDSGELLTEALDRLATDGLPHGAHLDRLTDDVHQTARRLDDKVLTVVLNGRTVYRHPGDGVESQ